MCERVVLFVDDKPNVLASNRDYFESEGYIVLTAENEEDALKLCNDEIVHVAVIDIHLRDDGDENDDSGIRLAEQLDESIGKIILTGQPFPNQKKAEDAFRTLFEPNVQGHPLADRFVRKNEGPEKVQEAINHVFSTRIRLDSHPSFVLGEGFSWPALVSQLKMYREGDDQTRQKAEQVLKDLTCRLFNKASEVNLKGVALGHSYCAVAIVQQSVRGIEGKTLAVKFGPRSNIKREEKRYSQFVGPIVEHSTHIELGPVWSRDMGAIAYSFVGEKATSGRTFLDYYQSNIVTTEQIKQTIDHLFNASCRSWYAGRQELVEKKRKPLDQLYRKYINLDDDAHIDALKERFNLLLNREFQGHTIRLAGDGALQLQITGLTRVDLPNPVDFALKDNRQNVEQDIFRAPLQVAITHGDLHSGNIMVGDAGRIWLIDFYKTGWGHVLRDFAELESDIKFSLFRPDNLLDCYQLAQATIEKPMSLGDKCILQHSVTTEQARALETIRHLRELACRLTGTEDLREYLVALLFYALKRIVGFSSSIDVEPAGTLVSYHALISAAMISQRLLFDAGHDKVSRDS